MTERPTCKTCPYYDAEAEVTIHQGQYERMGLAGGTVVLFGKCNRYSHPRVNHKKPDDWCGEHPEFEDWAEGFTPRKGAL
jgi:hypothetical protein